jgi:hypothetical protein
MSVLPWVVGVVENDDPSRLTEVGDLRTDLARSLSVVLSVQVPPHVFETIAVAALPDVEPLVQLTPCALEPCERAALMVTSPEAPRTLF